MAGMTYSRNDGKSSRGGFKGAASNRGALAGVRKWAKELPENMEATVQEALKDLRDEYDANVPVDTGVLKASLEVTVNNPPAPYNWRDIVVQQFTNAEQNAVIDSMKIGDRAYFKYQTPYAARLEFGFIGTDALGRYYNQPARLWMARAGAKWPSIFRAAATRLNMRVK